MPESDFDIFRGLSDSGASAPTDVEEKPKRRGLKITLTALLVLVLLIVGIAGYFGLRFMKSMDNAPTISDTDAFPEDANRPAEWVAPNPTESAAAKAPVNFLLLGSDSRGAAGTNFENLGDRSDVIMVVHVTPDRQSVEVVSIMRDLWVEIPGHGSDKINAALSLGGVQLMTQTVEQLIDQRIDHVAIIDFEGFKGLTDALGGVTVENERTFTGAQTGGPYDFPAGQITLDGEHALVYVRERYAFNDGDYQRVRNQRAYLQGVLNKTLSWEVMSNPVKLAQTMEAFAPFINRTGALTPANLASLGIEMGGMPKIQMFTFPTNGIGTEGDQSVVYPNWDGTQLVREAFKQESLTNWQPPAPY